MVVLKWQLDKYSSDFINILLILVLLIKINAEIEYNDIGKLMLTITIEDNIKTIEHLALMVPGWGDSSIFLDS